MIRPLLVAHRGASRQAPENTLPAFELAWQLGAEAIEGDFHQTADGHIVCIHDEHTGRVAGVKQVVARSDLAQLQQLDVGAWRGQRFRGTTIPTLADVLATVPEKKQIYIEIKCAIRALPAFETVMAASALRPEQMVVISFDRELIGEFKRRRPSWPAYWLTDFKKHATGITTPALDTVLETLRDTGADGLGADARMDDEHFVRTIIASGYKYNVWTVDAPAVARRFANWGVDSISTNDPGMMIRQLWRNNDRSVR